MRCRETASSALLDPARVLSSPELTRGSGISVITRPYLSANSACCSVSHQIYSTVRWQQLKLLLGTSGKGLTVVGKLAKKYLKGDLITVKDPNNGYVIKGDITVDNKIVLKNQTIIMDVGTDNIQGY